MICAVGTAHAEPAVTTLRPAVSRLGWTLAFDGFAQLDAVPYNQASVDELDPATREPLNQDTMFVRRALLRADARRDDWHAMIELGGDTLGGPHAAINEAWLEWSRRDLVKLKVGLMDIPFGVLTLTNARYRDFVEQPTFLRALFPGDRDAGVHATGAYGLVRWSLAMMDGAPVKDAQWKGRDPSSSYDLIGRLGTELPLPHHGRFAGGVSALTGDGLHPGTPPTKDQIIWVDENMDGIVQPTELQVIPGMPGEPSQSFHHDALGADAAVHWCLLDLGPGVASFEGALAKNLDRGVIYADPIARSRSIRELGFDVAVVQELGAHALAGVRYDRYDADRDASAQLGVNLVPIHQIFSTVAVMAAARWDTVRLIVEYDRNKNPFGRDDTGMPTTLSADRVTLRAQAQF